MSLDSWFEFLKTAARHGRGSRVRGPCARPCRAVQRRDLERLEDRSLLSGGLSKSLVHLGGATPLPIPLPLADAANPLGGPDGYAIYQGPANAPLNPLVGGNEPNTITNFKGFYGGARVQGTGTDNSGNTLLWDVDLRVMAGVYRGLDGKLHKGTFALV